jgi:hypothetical protein
VACAAAGAASGQFTTVTPGPNPLGGIMPGQVVGSSSVATLNPAATAVPKAAPPAGTAIGNPLMRPYDPTRPLDVFKGTNIDPRTVAAPVSGFPTLTTGQPDLLDKLYDKLSSVTRFLRPSFSAPPPTYTPGISRRNRERADQRMWRRD